MLMLLPKNGFIFKIDAGNSASVNDIVLWFNLVQSNDIKVAPGALTFWGTLFVPVSQLYP